MNHSFTASQLDSTKCARCKRDEIDHTNRATCECCSNSGICDLYIDILMCQDCLEKENSHKRQEPERAVAVMNINSIIDNARRIDQTVQVRTDLFNAATVAIVDLKKAIDEDGSIENKHFALATELTTRFNHFKKVIFEMSEEIVEKQNQQRAIQSYLNTLSNQLRVEEREKLKLQDINYKPESPKPIKKSAPTVKKVSKIEIREMANKYNVPELAVQMLCVAKNLSPEDAAKSLQKAMN